MFWIEGSALEMFWFEMFWIELLGSEMFTYGFGFAGFQTAKLGV